ncbi:hypothetical protein HYY75_00790 [bacterium]|nr:hypothetical protein [bacterium]
MKIVSPRIRRLAFLITFAILFNSAIYAEGKFELTSDGIQYVERNLQGQIIQATKPEFDASSGEYFVKDREKRVIARQAILPEAGMAQIKIVAPVQGESHSVMSRDFLGRSVPVLRELSPADPRYQQLKGYIESDPGLQRAVAMQLEARNLKISKLSQQLNEGTRDPAFTSWLISDLKKPVYLEVGDSGSIYHDPKGFILAEQGPNGATTYRENSQTNRLVIPSNSEAFQGGMNDSSAASVMAHELGHMVMDQLYETPNYPKTRYFGPHSKDSITDEGFAISEGWAEAMETLANKERLDGASSWRLKTQKNIAENKYIFKNQGVLDGPNDGILKNGAQQLSTEGVNASLFYKMLTDNHIQAPYDKVTQVFERYKPQTYRDFLKNYVEQFPEDRSRVIGQFLENTKYSTVSPDATSRYKAVHDAEQAYLNSPSNKPEVQAKLKSEYSQKLSEYNNWKDQVRQQAIVDGKIDKAVSGDASPSFSDETSRQYRNIKISETLLKGRKALGVGLNKAVDSVKQSFSVKNVAVTAGTAIAINLASQIMSGEKVSFKKAVSSIASLQFVGNVVGSTMGAAAGHLVAPLIQTFVPIPVVGAIAGALLPTLGAITGGKFTGDLFSKVGFKAALKNLDFVSISGQAVGSMVGSMLGAMIPIPVLGPMIGGIVGGILGEKVFTGIAKLFGRKKKSTPVATLPSGPINPGSSYGGQSLPQSPPPPSLSYSVNNSNNLEDLSKQRIDPSIDRIPYEKMHPNLRVVKNDYEKAYQAYVDSFFAFHFFVVPRFFRAIS